MIQRSLSLLMMFGLFGGIWIEDVQGGPVAYAICQTGCNTVWVACCTACGGTAGVAAPPAIVPCMLACNAANGICMTACVAAGAGPTP